MANEAKPIIDRSLLPETWEDRQHDSKILDRDIRECRARMVALSTPGVIDHPESGDEIVVSAVVTRAMFEAAKP